MYDRILLPTDGSRSNNPAVEQALGLAAETGAELHVLFVVEELPHAPELMDGEFEERLRAIGRDTIAEIRGRADAAGITTETALRDGTPDRAIVEYANEEGIDLIIMGTHGRRGLERYLLGSVTERVVRRAETPVLTVRMTPEE